jgi:MSHA biogenesis protein MshL
MKLLVPSLLLVAVFAACHSSPAAGSAPESAPSSPIDTFPGLGITLLPTAEVAVGADEPRITSLSARDTPLTDMLFALFKDSDINLLVEADTTGTATFDIKNATVAEGFQVLMSAFDLAWRWDGTFLRISPRERATFTIDLPNRTGSSGSVSGTGSGGSSSSGNDSGGTGSNPSANSNGSGGAPSDASASGNSGGSADAFWTRLQQDLRTLAQGEANASVVVNPLLGVVVTEGTPSLVGRIGDYVDTVRRRAARQVSIEARILEVQLSDGFRMGIDFAAFPGFFSSGKTGTLANGTAVGQNLAAGVEALQVGFLKPNQFSLFLDMLQSKNQVRVLSSPRVSTLNNVAATIRVVEQVPIIEREIIDTNGVSRTQFTVRFADAGVSVRVTPQIGEDGVISCEVAPSIVEVGGFVNTPDNLISEPILNTRSLATTLQIPDGQTAVIGGLRSTRKTENLTQIPLLGDIPLLGQLFSTTVQDRVDTELLIVLRPRILTGAWADEDLESGTDRLVRLRRPFVASPIDMEEGSRAWRDNALPEQPRRADGEPRQERAEGSATASPAVLTRSSLARLALARACRSLDTGHITQGRQEIDEAMGLDNRQAMTWLLRGIVDLTERRYASARRALQRSLELAPDDQTVRCNLGMLELRAGSPLAAEGHFRTALATNASAILHNNLGVALLQQGRLDEAGKSLWSAIETDNTLHEAYANLAIVKLRCGDRPGAGAAAREFLMRGGDLSDPRLAAVRDDLQQLTLPTPESATSPISGAPR